MSFGSSRRVLCFQRGSEVLIFCGEWTERGRFLAHLVVPATECLLDQNVLWIMRAIRRKHLQHLRKMSVIFETKMHEISLSFFILQHDFRLIFLDTQKI